MKHSNIILILSIMILVVMQYQIIKLENELTEMIVVVDESSLERDQALIEVSELIVDALK